MVWRGECPRPPSRLAVLVMPSPKGPSSRPRRWRSPAPDAKRDSAAKWRSITASLLEAAALRNSPTPNPGPAALEAPAPEPRLLSLSTGRPPSFRRPWLHRKHLSIPGHPVACQGREAQPLRPSPAKCSAELPSPCRPRPQTRGVGVSPGSTIKRPLLDRCQSNPHRWSTSKAATIGLTQPGAPSAPDPARQRPGPGFPGAAPAPATHPPATATGRQSAPKSRSPPGLARPAQAPTGRRRAIATASRFQRLATSSAGKAELLDGPIGKAALLKAARRRSGNTVD